MGSGRRLVLALILSLAGLAAPTLASFAAEPTIQAAGETYGGYYWLPSTAQVSPGGGVVFENASAVVPHGVVWTSSPEPPSCTGVPINEGKMSWKGKCVFTHPGIYNFHCYVHPTTMTGSVTVPGTPTAKTTPANQETQTEVVLNGSVDPEGNTVEYRFQYGSASASEHTTSSTSLGASDFASHAVSAQLAGLSPSTTYKLKLIAIYGASKTEVDGGEITFTTKAIAAPRASTGSAGGLKETEATLHGTVDPEGGAEAEYFFEWGVGSTGAYTHATPAIALPADGSQHPVSATLTGLQPGSEYHFRVLAKNALGEAPGLGMTFKTTSTPPKEPPSEPPPTHTGSETTSTAPPPTTTTTTTPAAAFTAAATTIVDSSLRLTAPRHAFLLRGSVEVSGAGGRLQIGLVTSPALHGRRSHAKQMTLGRLVRTSVSAGRVSFVVDLNAQGKRELRRQHRLRVIVKITLTPVLGKALTLTRSIVIRA